METKVISEFLNFMNRQIRTNSAFDISKIVSNISFLGHLFKHQNIGRNMSGKQIYDKFKNVPRTSSSVIFFVVFHAVFLYVDILINHYYITQHM